MSDDVKRPRLKLRVGEPYSAVEKVRVFELYNQGLKGSKLAASFEARSQRGQPVRSAQSLANVVAAVLEGSGDSA